MISRRFARVRRVAWVLALCACGGVARAGPPDEDEMWRWLWGWTPDGPEVAATMDVPGEGKSKAPPAPPLEESLKEPALADFLAGRALFEKADCEHAREKFWQAFDQSRDYRLLWELAACEKCLAREARAWAFVDRYLAEGAGRLTDAERRTAERFLETLRDYVGQVRVSVVQPQAEILANGEVVGVSPVALPIDLPVGKHTITVRRVGFRPFSTVLSLESRKIEMLDVSLQAVEPGRLRVRAGVGNAIFVDGKLVGKTTWEGALVSGRHAVRVTASRMVPFESHVVVREDVVALATVALRPKAADARKDGNGLGPWPWVVGGALGVGLGLLAVVLVAQ